MRWGLSPESTRTRGQSPDPPRLRGLSPLSGSEQGAGEKGDQEDDGGVQQQVERVVDRRIRRAPAAHRRPHRLAIRRDAEPLLERERSLLDQHRESIVGLEPARAAAARPRRASAAIREVEHRDIRGDHARRDRHHRPVEPHWRRVHKQVRAFEQQRNGLRLDGRGRFVADVGERGHDGGVQAEIGKGDGGNRGGIFGHDLVRWPDGLKRSL